MGLAQQKEENMTILSHFCFIIFNMTHRQNVFFLISEVTTTETKATKTWTRHAVSDTFLNGNFAGASLVWNRNHWMKLWLIMFSLANSLSHKHVRHKWSFYTYYHSDCGLDLISCLWIISHSLRPSSCALMNVGKFSTQIHECTVLRQKDWCIKLNLISRFKIILLKCAGMVP